MSWLSSIFAAMLSDVRTGDAQLLHRVAAGDRGALHELYVQTAPRAMAIAMRVLKDRAEAEDVLQETFLEVWKRAPQFDEHRGSVSAWLITMTRNRALDRLRARKSSERAVTGAGKEPALPASPPPNELADERRDRVRVAEALAALPAEQRLTIELAYFEGLTQTEIATHTGEALGTVKTRVRLAMAKLADMLTRESRGAA